MLGQALGLTSLLTKGSKAAVVAGIMLLGSSAAFAVTVVLDPTTALRGAELIRNYLVDGFITPRSPQSNMRTTLELLAAMRGAAGVDLPAGLATNVALANSQPALAFRDLDIPPIAPSSLLPQSVPMTPPPVVEPVAEPILRPEADLSLLALQYQPGGAPGGTPSEGGESTGSAPGDTAAPSGNIRDPEPTPIAPTALLLPAGLAMVLAMARRRSGL